MIIARIGVIKDLNVVSDSDSLESEILEEVVSGYQNALVRDLSLILFSHDFLFVTINRRHHLGKKSRFIIYLSFVLLLSLLIFRENVFVSIVFVLRMLSNAGTIYFRNVVK